MSDTKPQIFSDEVAKKHFADAHKALYELVGLFITGPLEKHASRPEVRKAISTLAQIAKDRPSVH
jgi:hypothetical protein